MQNFKYFDLRQLRIIVELRVDVVNVAVQEEWEGGNVLEADKVRRGAYDAGEHEELVELVVTYCECMSLSFCDSLCLRPALLDQRVRMLRAQLGLLDMAQEVQESVAVGMVRR